MQVVKSFDPSAATSGNISIGSADPGSKILLYNLSIINILLNFDNGDSALLHAGEANYWELDGSTTLIAWSQYSILNIPSPAISQVTGTVYRSDETIDGNYPMSFVNQVNVGGAVQVGNANSLTNTGNPPLTNIINVNPSNALATWTADNSGNLSIKSDNAGVLANLLQLTAGASPKVLLAAAAILTEIAGTLQVDQAATFNALVTAAASLAVTGTISSTGAATINGLLTAAASLSVTGTINATNNVSGSASGNFAGNSLIAGSTLASTGITSAGNVSANQYALTGSTGNYGLYTGSLSRISIGTFSTTGAAQTITHNLGAIPSVVLLTVNAAIGTVASVAAYSYTATTFTALSSGSGTQVIYMALRQ